MPKGKRTATTAGLFLQSHQAVCFMLIEGSNRKQKKDFSYVVVEVCQKRPDAILMFERYRHFFDSSCEEIHNKQCNKHCTKCNYLNTMHEMDNGYVTDEDDNVPFTSMESDGSFLRGYIPKTSRVAACRIMNGNEHVFMALLVCKGVTPHDPSKKKKVRTINFDNVPYMSMLDSLH